jgi:hypothetical protein
VSARKRLLLLGGIAPALAACLYVPTPEHGTTAGAYHPARSLVSDESIAALTPGKTRREDVLLQLGDPVERRDRHSSTPWGDRYFIYRWQRIQGYLLVYGAGAAAVSNEYALAVEFGPDDRIVRVGRFESSLFGNIRKELEQWIAASP